MKFRTSSVHSHRTSIEHLSIQVGNCCFGFRLLCHLDEGDTAWLASIPVLDNRDSFDASMGCKKFSQLLLCHRDIEVPDKNISHEFILRLTSPEYLCAKIEAGYLEKAILTDIAFSQGVALRAALRSQPASPSGL
jgi:hypothetical protein